MAKKPPPVRSFTLPGRLPEPPLPRIVKNKCLSCGKKFMATGKFNRICEECEIENEKIEEEYRLDSYSLSSLNTLFGFMWENRGLEDPYSED